MNQKTEEHICDSSQTVIPVIIFGSLLGMVFARFALAMEWSTSWSISVGIVVAYVSLRPFIGKNVWRSPAWFANETEFEYRWFFGCSVPLRFAEVLSSQLPLCHSNYEVPDPLPDFHGTPKP